MKRLQMDWMTINPQNVLRQLQIEPKSSLGVEALARITNWERSLKPKLNGKVGFKLHREPQPDGEPGTVYCAISLGSEISYELDALSCQGRIWEVSILDVLADQWLIQGAQHQFLEIAEMCTARGWGMTTRKMPGSGYPLSLAGKIIEELCDESTAIKYNEPGFMEPVKSLAYFYEISAHGTVPLHDEECSTCSRQDCPRRMNHVPVEIITDDEILTVEAIQGETLLKILNEAGCAPDAPCAGRGVCGRCLVEIQSESDERKWVRACAHAVEQFTKVWIPAGESWQMASMPHRDIVMREPFIKRVRTADFFNRNNRSSSVRIEALRGANAVDGLPNSGWFIEREGKITGFSPDSETLIGAAVDLGSTTAVIKYIDLETGKILRTEGFSNPLRAYGADVISRLSDASKQHTMTQLIRRRLEQVLEEPRHLHLKPSVIAVAGNNAMVQILLGLSSEGLARAPYWHWLHAVAEAEAGDLWPDRSGMVVVMPGVSPFTGGDLTAGIVHCGIHKTKLKTLYMDLGTNGEMALGNEDGILVTAAAAGPAFENLEGAAGIGAVPGAIQRVQYLGNGRWHLETIGGKDPVGLCGSGLFSLLAEMLRYSLIGADGTFIEEDEAAVMLSPGIEITQQDIRNFQLAKAALRAGTDVLLKQMGWQVEEIDQVIIAGGFSMEISAKDLIAIGLLPKIDKHRVAMVGNACLGGVCDILLNKDAREWIYNASDSMTALNLAENPDFEALFIEHINFRQGAF